MALKKYLPVFKYRLTTQLSLNEVCRRLRENTLTKNASESDYFLVSGNTTFEVKVNENRFEIRVTKSGRHGFLPVVFGSIHEGLAGTSLDITMRLPKIVIAFVVVWVSFVTFGVVAGIIALTKSLINGHFQTRNIADLMPIGMLLFFYFILDLSFTGSCFECRKFLAVTLEGEEEL